MKKGLVVISFLPLLLFSCGEPGPEIILSPIQREEKAATQGDFSLYLDSSEEDALEAIKKNLKRPTWFSSDLYYDRILESASSTEEAASIAKKAFTDTREGAPQNIPSKIDVQYESPFYYQIAVEWNVYFSNREDHYAASVICFKKDAVDFSPNSGWRGAEFHMRLIDKDHAHELIDLSTSPTTSRWLCSRIEESEDEFVYEYLWAVGTYVGWWNPNAIVIEKTTLRFAKENGNYLGSHTSGELRTIKIPDGTSISDYLWAKASI